MLVVKNLPANARDVSDMGLNPWSGRSSGGGHGNPLQYSCLEYPISEETGWLQPLEPQESDTTQRASHHHIHLNDDASEPLGSRPGDHKLSHARESPGGLTKAQITGPHLQSFWFSKSEARPKSVHFWQALRLYQDCWLQGTYFENHCTSNMPTLGFRHSVQFSSVAQPCPTLRPDESQHTRPPCPSQTPRVYSNTCPSSRWCPPTISSSVIPFSSCPQSLPASGFFQWVNSSHEVAKVLEFRLQHQSFQWMPRTDLL